MCQELPDTLEKARENCSRDYAYTTEEITKKVLTTKLIAIYALNSERPWIQVEEVGMAV